MAKPGKQAPSGQDASTGGPTGSEQRNPFASGRSGPNISLMDADGQLIVEALNAALDQGVLVSLGRTSDGGAIGCYVTDGSERYKSWAGEPDELTLMFEQLRDAYK
jgi:hypothetical protein